MSNTSATRPTSAAGRRRRNRATAPISALLALILLTIGLTACGGPNNALGSLLAGLSDQVNAIITNASNQGQVLVITAGGQVELALSNVESEFAADLNKNIQDLDAATQANIDQLQVLVNDLGSQSQAVITSAVDGSQQLINSLPITNKNPQVRTYSPEYLGRRGSNVQIQVSGNFFYASEQNKAVTLSVGGQTFQPDLNTTTSVGFSVPASAFPQATDSPTPVSMTLTAPYQTGSLFGKSIVPGTFHLLVTGLPTNPIKSLTLTNTTTVRGTEKISKVAPAQYATSGIGYRVQSWSSCTDQAETDTISADPGGWSIVPSSIAINYISRGYAPRGQADIAAASPTGFSVQGHTQANCILGVSSNSGDIQYYVSYTEQRDTTTSSTNPADLLAANPGFSWGDSISQPVTPHAWTLKAVLWDGRTLETSSSSNSNPYIQVADKTDEVEVSLITPGSLSGL